MPRKSAVYDYFNEEGDGFRCIISDKECRQCNEFVPKLKKGGGVSSNLKRHLLRHHKQEHGKVEDEDAKRLKKEEEQPKGQRSIVSIFPKAIKKATASITREDFVKGILKMIVYNGVPLTFFQEEGFQLLNGSFAESLKVPLGRDSIREMVIEKFCDEKQKLTESLSGTMLSVKFDGATRLRSHFLGISIQFWDEDDGLTVKTLALVDTEANHTSDNIKNILLDTLGLFKITKSQILACVVDNASNMTRTIQLLNDEDEASDEDEDDPAETVKIDSTIHHMRCAEHTLQLGIRDALKKGRPEKFVTKIRKVAQHLRTSHTDGILKRRAGKGMLIDMPTRWGSTFLMLERLLHLKAVVQDLDSVDSYLSESEWGELENMVDILRIPYNATISLQKQDLTPGECLLHWRGVIFKLEKYDKSLASVLASSLKAREKFILSNHAFLAAVWVSEC